VRPAKTRGVPRRKPTRRRTADRSFDQLSEAAAAIAAGDRERRLPRPNDRALAPLSDAVNAIVDALALKERLLGENIRSLEQVNRELRDAQESLVRTEKLAALGRVSAGIAHEIGNPIGAILGYLDLIKRRVKFDADVRDSFSRVEAEAWRISAIIRETLDFARPSSGVVGSVDVNELVVSALDDLSRQAAFAGVHIARNLAAELPAVEANHQRLRQVLLNLLSNARDALEAEGEIEVATRVVDSDDAEAPPLAISPGRGDPPEVDYSHLQPVLDFEPTFDRPLSAERHWVELRVTDSGSGIPPETLREVFKPFFTTKPPGKGTGLGLPLSLSIVRALRGRMRIESRVGVGTTVTVQIPVLRRALEG
jgi:two-component system, NtrC family, sensor kinase